MPANIEHFELSLDEDALARIDQWRAEQDDSPTRTEAIHRLLRKALLTAGEFKLSTAEKLIVSLLCDVSQHLKIASPAIDPTLTADALRTRNLWALTWENQTILGDEEEHHEVEVDFVADVLQMWTELERAYKELSNEEKSQIKTQVTLPPFTKFLQFPGFDGNHETRFVSIANFLINKMDHYANFKGRDLHTSFCLSEYYAQMLPVYKATHKRIDLHDLTVPEIVAILNASRLRTASV